MKTKNTLLAVAILSMLVVRVSAQQPIQNATEQRVPLSEAAVALDAQGRPAVLEREVRRQIGVDRRAFALRRAGGPGG